MALVSSTMLPLGTPLPQFSLPDTTSGRQISSADFAGQAVLVAFICNHCPYVRHIQSTLVQLGQELPAQGVALLAISSNDPEYNPEDSPERMKAEAERLGYAFPYLFDETQEVARAFQAVCTPEFYLFDEKARLIYRGQLDDARPQNDAPLNAHSLRAALAAWKAGEPPLTEQKPSIGCNIKWKSAPESTTPP